MKYSAFLSVLVCMCICLDAQDVTDRERQLLERIENLERRLADLESKTGSASPPAPAPATTTQTPSTPGDSPSLPGFLAGTTINFNMDGYYGYNFNRPLGRVNLLRAYDVSSNNFSLDQMGVIVERALDVAAGRRLGVRLDLMFGQATEATQGGAQNEPRPQVYRNVFQPGFRF